MGKAKKDRKVPGIYNTRTGLEIIIEPHGKSYLVTMKDSQKDHYEIYRHLFTAVRIELRDQKHYPKE